MIITSPTKLKVGSVIREGSLNINKDFENLDISEQPIFIVREATKEEWFNDLKSDPLVRPPHIPFDYFYEISTD